MWHSARWHNYTVQTFPDSYTKQVNHTHIMDFDTCLWDEIQDAPGEIFDIPESWDDNDHDDRTWNAFLNSNWDFWCLTSIHSQVMVWQF